MTANTAQRVDVEQFFDAIAEALPAMFLDDAASVRGSYAALLLQVAELKTANDHYHMAMNTGVIDEWRDRLAAQAAEIERLKFVVLERNRRAEAAERAREEAKKVWFPILGTPFAIRRDALNEEQAKQNHGQTLDRLAQRGGLSPDEALAVAERRPFRSVAYQQAFAAFLAANGGGRED